MLRVSKEFRACISVVFCEYHEGLEPCHLHFYHLMIDSLCFLLAVVVAAVKPDV